MKTNVVKPNLVQRCKLEGGEIRYDYMGSTEFEVGDQARALKKLFKCGMKEAELTITATRGKKVRVFLVVPKDFDANDYLPHLQGLADNKFRMQEPSYFDRVVNPGEFDHRFPPRVNVWFDFTSNSTGENIVLWTLSRENQRKLTAALKNIKSAWAAKS